MKADISSWELHNLVNDGDNLRTRRALTVHKTASATFIGGFTVESPFTTEPWHYTFEQATTGVVTLRVWTEEFAEVYNYNLGAMQKDPVITWGVQNNQGMINSPSFSAPLYFVVGGGLVTATKTASANTDTTAIDIPNGHICSFGDRFPIAQGNIVYFNDPPSANGVDPRTYTAQGAISLPGSVLDMFQGPDGALYMFTTNGVFTMPQDALGQGQSVNGFISRIPGIETTRSRNAIASSGFVVVLQRDSVVLITGGVQKKIPINRYAGRRSFSKAVDVEDLRLSGELYPTPTGFIIGFRGRRGFYLQADVVPGGGLSIMYVTSTLTALNVTGTLRSRDGDSLAILTVGVYQLFMTAVTDGIDLANVVGVACGRIAGGRNTSVIRRVVVASGVSGFSVGAYVGGSSHTKTSPALTGEAVIGTSLWGAGTTVSARRTRTVRNSYSVQDSDPNVEIVVTGADRRLMAEVEFVTNGQVDSREDKN